MRLVSISVESLAGNVVVSVPGAPGGGGSPGPAGASAYQIALQEGFIGTRAEWLASLVGPPGTNGFGGFSSIEVVTAYPDPEIPGVLYILVPAP